MHDQPEPPSQHTAEFDLAEVHHCGHAADGGEVAVVLVRIRLATRQAREYVGRYKSE